VGARRDTTGFIVGPARLGRVYRRRKRGRLVESRGSANGGSHPVACANGSVIGMGGGVGGRAAGGLVAGLLRGVSAYRAWGRFRGLGLHGPVCTQGCNHGRW